MTPSCPSERAVAMSVASSAKAIAAWPLMTAATQRIVSGFIQYPRSGFVERGGVAAVGSVATGLAVVAGGSAVRGGGRGAVNVGTNGGATPIRGFVVAESVGS